MRRSKHELSRVTVGGYLFIGYPHELVVCKERRPGKVIGRTVYAPRMWKQRHLLHWIGAQSACADWSRDLFERRRIQKLFYEESFRNAVNRMFW